MLASVRRITREDHPLGLLILASQFLELSRVPPLAQLTGATPTVEIGQLVESFIDIERPETTALLQALAVLTTDRLLEQTIRTGLALRPQPLHGWLAELDQARVVTTSAVTHILRDGDSLLIGVAWPSGKQMTALVYIDHNVGTVVKDAFVIPTDVSAAIEVFETAQEVGSSIVALSPADARTRILEAIEDGEHHLHPFKTETWPDCRAIVEWTCRMLPKGGIGYARPEWSEPEQDALAARFLTSRFTKELGGDTAELVRDLLWFGCDYGPGDPLRWSPVSVEVFMVDWFPRKIVADRRYLHQMPEALRAFIRFAHAEREIPAILTAETLEAVDRWEPDFRRAVADPHRQMGVVAFDEATRMFLDIGSEQSQEEYMLDRLANQVGGRDTLDRLDDRPLPDEPFDWTGIPDDIRPRVNEVLGWVDRCCNELLDTEYRTIARRLLSRAATGAPEVFRRRARTDYAAAALLWLAGRANDLFRHMTVKSLMEWFGIGQGSVSQRAATLRKAAGLPTQYGWSLTELGDPALLHSLKRRDLIRWRDRYQKDMGAQP